MPGDGFCPNSKFRRATLSSEDGLAQNSCAGITSGLAFLLAIGF